MYIKNNQIKKGFHIPCKAWYADAEERKYIIIGMYDDKWILGEFRIQWEDVGLRLDVHEDAWMVLYQMPELIRLLADIGAAEIELSIEVFAGLLKKLGFIDRTAYERG